MKPPCPLIPLGQVLTRSDEYVELKPEHTYSQVTVRLWGKGAVLRNEVLGAEIASSRRFVVRKDQFLISRIDARNGACGIVPEELDAAVVSNDFPSFVVSAERLLPSYLGWLSKTRPFVADCKRASEGTTNRVRLQEDRFLATTIPLPPLAEQRRIVAKIEALAAKIEEARALRRQATEEIEALASSAVAALFQAGTGSGWQRGCLDDYVVDSCYGTSEKTTDDATGTPILRMGNIQNGRLSLRDLKYLHLSDRERQKLLLQRGDILVNRTNSAELVGKCAVFDQDAEYAFASYLIRLRIDRTKADPWLVAKYVNSPMGRAYMFQERKQQCGQANVNSKKLRALPIALPPLNEQRRAVAYLDDLQSKVDALRQFQSQTAAELAALLPSILDKAFKGEL